MTVHWGFLLLLAIAQVCVAAPKYGPAGEAAASPLSGDHAYLQNPRHPAPDYWAISSFYVPQANEWSCSVASVAAVVNALTRAGRPLTDADKNATHASLLSAVKAVHWAERVQSGGFEGSVGLTLDQLAEVVAEAMKQNGVANVEVGKVEVRDSDKATRDLWRKTLSDNEANSDDILLIHFTQNTLTGSDGIYPHISPIGAFDPDSGRVLVFDVDRDYYEPYWVDADLVLKAMATETPAYGHGGWIRVSLQRPAS